MPHTRREAARLEEIAYGLPHLPGYNVTDVIDLLRPREPPAQQIPPPIENRQPRSKSAIMTTVGNVKIPSFGGENYSSWLKNFRMAMLMLDFDENDTKQAKFFAVCLVEGSVASEWFEGLTAVQKASWTALQPLLKARFGESVEDKHSAFREMVSLRLPDKDVGVNDDEDLPKHVSWARKISVLAKKAGEDPNDNNAYLVYNNVGEALQTILSNTGNTSSVSKITSKIETLSPVEVESVANKVRRDEQAQYLQTRLQALERQFSGRQPLGAQSSQNQQQQSQGQGSSYERQAQPSGSENIQIGPFPNTQAGIADYKAAVNGWYAKYGSGGTSSLSRPFPLSPGTVAAGSNECFNCGHTTHLRVNCPAKTALPINEQRYRGMVMQSRRKLPSPATGPNLQTPIRAMGWSTPDDMERFGHLYSLPPTPDVSPETRFGHLPEFHQGNELGLDL